MGFSALFLDNLIPGLSLVGSSTWTTHIQMPKLTTLNCTWRLFEICISNPGTQIGCGTSLEVLLPSSSWAVASPASTHLLALWLEKKIAVQSDLTAFWRIYSSHPELWYLANLQYHILADYPSVLQDNAELWTQPLAQSVPVFFSKGFPPPPRKLKERFKPRCGNTKFVF